MARPNILIVCTDQQRTDTLSCYGSDFIDTPGFDRVAERGTRYERAYCPSAVCTPSRVSLMTGQYTMRHGIWNVGVNTGGDVDFLSHRLARAGYQTRLVGKAHYESYNAGASQSRESSADYGSGYGGWTGPYYGFEKVELALGHTVYGLSGHYGEWLGQQEDAADLARYRKLQPADDAPEFGGNAYNWALPARFSNSVWTADRAIAFLEHDRDRERPFFLFVGFQDPHHPHCVPTDYSGKLDPALVPLPAYTEGELDSMPPHFQLAHEGRLKGSEIARRWPVAGQHDGFDYRQVPESSQRLGRSYYYSMVKLIDEQLQRLWASLDASGLTENTLVFVTSDHGELLGDHGLWMKGPFHYEPLTRIPLLAMGPGVAAGASEDALASLVDIAPTCLSMAGVSVDDDMDGIDLTRKRRTADDTVLCETILDWQGLICRSVIGERYKLTWYADADYGELFDLAHDSGETENLWSSEGMAPVRARLLSALVNHDTRMQASHKERVAYA